MLTLLCDTLQLPLFLDEPGDPLRLNAAARDRLGHATADSLSEALEAGGLAPDDLARVGAAVMGARAGGEAVIGLQSGERAIVVPTAKSGVGVILAAPHQPAERQVAADISHELANALAAITGWARLARQSTDPSEALELIENSATAAWAAARRILGKERPARQLALDLSAFVEEVGRLLAWKARERGVVARVSAEPGIQVVGDRGHAWSIVWNLVINALEALPDGGHLNLRVSRTNGRAVLEVIDDGPGMAPSVRARAFERRFTTKATGSGLGLALVKETTESLGGHVELQSEPGKGTRVRVELPCQVPSRREASRASGVYYAGPVRGRVLVVDDDTAVRELIATALRMRGAEVTAVATADEALAQAGRFDFAIVDLQLAGVQGDALLTELRSRGAVRHALLVTGAEEPLHQATSGERDPVLRKPFELDDLFGRIPEDMREDDDARDGATRRI